MRRPARARLSGLYRTALAGHGPARALAIADSRSLVRSLFLSSAIRSGLLDPLAGGCTAAELAGLAGCRRADRLQAWLEVGTELGALARRGDRYRLRGRRARAIASGDAVLRAHYRSMLGYQAGCYESLTELLLADPGQGRDDLSQHAGDIARVSQAAVPFVGSYLTEVIRAARPRRILDAGCGTGVYSRIAAAAGPDVLVDGIDLSQDVIRTARAQVRAAGLQDRIRLHAADVRSWTPPDGGRYDLVLLLSNLYYFPSEQRTGLLRQLGGMLAGHGQLVVATMTVPGSVAAAHLNFMLTCQQGAAALPRPGEIEAQMRYAGFGTIRASAIVPGEPFAAIRAQIS